jgi:hypothetical protein
MVDIYYKGRKIYTQLSYEDAVDILHEMALESYEGNTDIDLNELNIEEHRDLNSLSPESPLIEN